MNNDPMAFFPLARFIEAAMGALVYDSDGRAFDASDAELEEFSLRALCLARLMQLALTVPETPPAWEPPPWAPPPVQRKAAQAANGTKPE